MARPPIAFKPRARLTQSQAIDIFKMKNSASSAVKIAVCYGVSEKAVRDIWKGRTWSTETCHLDTARKVVPKQVGRPKGCRDQKPRKRRVDTLFRIRKAITGKRSASSFEQGQEIMMSWFARINYGNQESQSDYPKDLIEECFSPFYVEKRDESPPSCAARVDEQLSTWNETLWINSRNPDPFRDDWVPMIGPSL